MYVLKNKYIVLLITISPQNNASLFQKIFSFCDFLIRQNLQIGGSPFVNCVNCNCPFVNNNNNIKKGWGDFFCSSSRFFSRCGLQPDVWRAFFCASSRRPLLSVKNLSTWRPPEHTDQEISAFHYNRWWVLVSSRYIDWSNPKKAILFWNILFYFGAKWRSKREFHIICIRITWNHN